MSHILDANARHPIVTPSLATAIGEELLTEYHIIKFKTPAVSTTAGRSANVEVPYSINGDYIYVHRIFGGGTLQIALNKTRNAWVDIDEGMIINRRFNQIRLRDASDGTLGFPSTQAILIVTSGAPFAYRTFKNKGLRGLPGFVSGISNVHENWQLVADLVSDAYGSPKGLGIASDICGGEVVIQNDNATIPVYIGYTWVTSMVPGTSSVVDIGAGLGFKLAPGKAITLNLESKMDRIIGTAAAFGASGKQVQGLVIATGVAGTDSDVSILVSHMHANLADEVYANNKGVQPLEMKE